MLSLGHLNKNSLFSSFPVSQGKTEQPTRGEGWLPRQRLIVFSNINFKDSNLEPRVGDTVIQEGAVLFWWHTCP